VLVEKKVLRRILGVKRETGTLVDTVKNCAILLFPKND
jgi:hypothetical protein